ncbi:hypothetical protein KY284_012794 [Solanum tuberosum]|nr:hypothetical protein KY284_012794 [Solanum tuberosum]
MEAVRWRIHGGGAITVFIHNNSGRSRKRWRRRWRLAFQKICNIFADFGVKECSNRLVALRPAPWKSFSSF